LKINASGVVLRGSGPGANGTILNLTGKPHNCIEVRGAASSKLIGDSTTIADSYVPAGGYSFNVTVLLSFQLEIQFVSPASITDEWIKIYGNG
jgi:hypothetical protein